MESCNLFILVSCNNLPVKSAVLLCTSSCVRSSSSLSLCFILLLIFPQNQHMWLGEGERHRYKRVKRRLWRTPCHSTFLCSWGQWEGPYCWDFLLKMIIAKEKKLIYTTRAKWHEDLLKLAGNIYHTGEETCPLPSLSKFNSQQTNSRVLLEVLRS